MRVDRTGAGRALYLDKPQLLGWGLLQRPSMSSAEALEFLVRVIAISLTSGLQFLLMLSIIGNFVRSEKTVGFLGVVLSLATLIVSGEVRTGGVESILIGGLMPSAMVLPASYGGPEGSYDDLDVMRQVLAGAGGESLRTRWPVLVVQEDLRPP